MNRISIYGKPSYTYDVLKGRVLETINQANLRIHLNEFNSVKMFIDENIDSIPAIGIDNEIRTIGKSSLTDFIDEVQSWILNSDPYNNRKVIAAIDLEETSMDVLNYAIQFSKDNYFPLELIHICHPSPNDMDINSWDGVLRLKEKAIDDLISSIDPDKKIARIKKTVIQGFAKDVIKLIGAKSPDSILIFGSKATSKNSKNFLGTMSLSAIDNSQNPIIVLPNTIGSSKISNVAFAVNDFETDKKSFVNYMKVMKSTQPYIHFVSYQNPAYQAEELKYFVKKNNPELKVYFHHLTGSNLLNSVNNFCLDNHIDLLVATKTEKGILKRLFESSLTKQLVLEPSTSLLILK